MILTANEILKTTWEAHNLSTILPQLAKYGVQPETSTTGILEAEINHGRWIVKCECNGAEKAWEEGLFMCLSCLNGAHKHQYRKVVFPEQRVDIESVLLCRPIPNRNWHPGEIVDQLKAENEEHKEELL